MQLPAVLLHRGTRRPQRAVWNRSIPSTDGQPPLKKAPLTGTGQTVRCIASAVPAVIFPQRFTAGKRFLSVHARLQGSLQGSLSRILPRLTCAVNADSLGNAVLLFYFYPANPGQSGISARNLREDPFFRPKQNRLAIKKARQKPGFLSVDSL